MFPTLSFGCRRKHVFLQEEEINPKMRMLPEYRHVVKEGMPEHRNAGTPECRNTGMPEHLNAGTPECRNTVMPEYRNTGISFSL
jgi:hypothetical protein